MDYWKKRNKQKTEALAREEIDELAAGPSNDPATQAELTFDMQQLSAACEQLSDGQREIISLRFARRPFRGRIGEGHG